jgi:ADP-ribose pyrophosphatase YjhB (NUDIX family)
MNFCSACGSSVSLEIPVGDNRLRYVCSHCKTIHYSNPNIIAGCIPIYKEEYVLLCKRAIEPRLGYWTLPAGFMENGESVEEAALRETVEEACAQVEIRCLYTVTSIVPVNQVQMLYLAELKEPEFATSIESSEVALFHLDEIPWDDLAFQTIQNALRFYINDRHRDDYPLHRVLLDANVDISLEDYPP